MSAKSHPSHATAKATSFTAGAATVEKARDHRRLRILSVEDMQDNQEFITLILSSAGHSVDCAANGSEAITLHAENAYDLILMDIQMPVMDGVEATQRIRQSNRPRNNVPILAMTGNTQPERIEQLSTAGITDVIAKPFRKADLLKKVALSIMHNDGHTPHASASCKTAPPDFNQGDFDEFVALMGPDTVLRWIDNLHMKLLPSLLETEGDLKNRLAVVHDIVAKAGMLGFRRLSASCARLEQQILDHSSLTEFATTQREARRVHDALPRLREMMKAW